MLCFEVYRNGEKLCTAGVGEFGVLTAIVSWVSRHPEHLARLAAEGITDAAAVELAVEVGGLVQNEYMKWVSSALSPGDEICVRVVEAPAADPPARKWQPGGETE